MKFQLERYPSNDRPQPILTPRSEIEWEGKAVFNPSVVYNDGKFSMLYRTFSNKLEYGEPRLKRPGYYLKNQASYIGYAESKNGIDFFRKEKPFISLDLDYDRYGCEDPRITKIDDTFYITYTAIDGPLEDREHRPNARIALATTKDFVTVKKHGIIGPDIHSKAASFFPERIKDGKIGLLMTISADSINSRVKIHYFDSIEEITNTSFENWSKLIDFDSTVLQTQWWLHRGPELGATPVKTDRGWLLIYSTESMSDTWTIGAALLEINNPDKLIARTPGYILQPVTDYERDGNVPNVTFPEGAVIVGDTLFVYYGAADTVIGLATCKLNDLLDYIESFKK